MHVNPHSPHILAINDDQDILDLMQELFEEEGYRVTAMRAPLPTPDVVVALQPDVMIVDYIWGSEDSGWSLLQRLRDDSRTKDLPIILCTGAVQQLAPVQDQLPAMQVMLVLKPFDINELVRTVSQVLGQDTSGIRGTQPGP